MIKEVDNIYEKVLALLDGKEEDIQEFLELKSLIDDEDMEVVDHFLDLASKDSLFEEAKEKGISFRKLIVMFLNKFDSFSVVPLFSAIDIDNVYMNDEVFRSDLLDKVLKGSLDILSLVDFINNEGRVTVHSLSYQERFLAAYDGLTADICDMKIDDIFDSYVRERS